VNVRQSVICTALLVIPCRAGGTSGPSHLQLQYVRNRQSQIDANQMVTQTVTQSEAVQSSRACVVERGLGIIGHKGVIDKSGLLTANDAVLGRKKKRGEKSLLGNDPRPLEEERASPARGRTKKGGKVVDYPVDYPRANGGK
jgi:hypothetical protein